MPSKDNPLAVGAYDKGKSNGEGVELDVGECGNL